MSDDEYVRVEAFLQLAEIVRQHLSDHESMQDYITFGPEPSDNVRDLIETVRGDE